MYISRFLICFLVVGLGACSQVSKLFGFTSNTPKSVVYDTNRSISANAKTFYLFVGSPLELRNSGYKDKPKNTVKVGDINYGITETLANQADIRSAFVAKTVVDEPALGLRLNTAVNKRLKQALKKNKKNVVLASLNHSVFSKVGDAGAELQDGVLLLPMRSLNEARDAADLFRTKKKRH